MLPKIVWPYSLYKKAGNFVYLSGQIGIDPETGKLEEWTWKQTQRAIENIKAICEEARIDISDICKTTIFLSDISEYSRVNGIYEIIFKHHPARSCVAVKDLPAWALVEIECIAYKE